jgi:hypothetical protein
MPRLLMNHEIMRSAMRKLDLEDNTRAFLNEGEYRLLNVDSGGIDDEAFKYASDAVREAALRNRDRGTRGLAWVVVRLHVLGT